MLPVIQVEDLSKAYQIGEFSTGTIAHDIRRWYIRMRGKEDPYLRIGEENDRTVKGESNIVWSLKDLNFEIEQGDAIGIIGRNGAGKSTLLKILSRVTVPTSGTVKVKGRIASLLEVGTGFHPELTGRENVFLNGAILGMRKQEIKRKFDEIVDFSGVERYIDTPVKRYSSGMYVRLAFAVAAHLESEILIIDEVLAVGDAEFQKKCLGKMGDVSKGEGRTVLFVSHNMAAISNLCPKAIYLKNGSLIDYSNTREIIERYISSGKENTAEIYEDDITYLQKCSEAYFNSIKLVSRNESTTSVAIGDDVHVHLEYTVTIEGAIISPSVHLLDNLGTVIFATFNANSTTINPDPLYGKPMKKGKYLAICTIPAYFLNDLRYTISVFLVPEKINEMAMVPEVLSFSVIETGDMRKEYIGDWIGLIRPKFDWKTKFLDNGVI